MEIIYKSQPIEAQGSKGISRQSEARKYKKEPIIAVEAFDRGS
jgi:hypothetical protein